MRDEDFLARAFILARYGRFTTAPNPNVGCIIVRNGSIVGEGYHQRAGEPHAEVYALRLAGKAACGATAYVTLEPCNHFGRTPPCTEALIMAGIVRVVAASADPNPQITGTGFHRLQQAGIVVCHILMSEESEVLNQGFFKRMRTGLPWLRLKLASSLDGRTAMASGKSQWITSIESRRDVQRLRAESDAILSTYATVSTDNPSLNVRWAALPQDVQIIYSPAQLRQPVRIIIDTANRLTPDYRIFQQQGEIWLVRLTPDEQVWPTGVSQLILSRQTNPESESKKHIDLGLLLVVLGRRQINSVLVEAGAELAGALLMAGLVDELIVYLAPKILGAEGKPLCCLPGITQLKAVPNLVLLDIRQVGPDLRLLFKPMPAPK